MPSLLLPTVFAQLLAHGSPTVKPVSEAVTLAPTIKSEILTLSPYQIVPAVYSHRWIRIFDSCKALPKKSAPGNCSELEQASKLVDSNFHVDKHLLGVATAQRMKLLQSMRLDYEDTAILALDDLPRLSRFLAYLDTNDLLGYLAAQPVEEGLLERVITLKKSLDRAKPGFQELEKAIEPDSRTAPSEAGSRFRQYANLFYLMDSRLLLHHRMAVYWKLYPKVHESLSSPRLSIAFSNYEYDQLLSSLPDSMRAKREAPRWPRFAHKLRNLLHDAVWVEEEKSAGPFALSSFLLSGNGRLDPGDSTLITRRLRDFGLKNRELAYRIDRKDPNTWKNEKYAKLDRLAVIECGEILDALSPAFRSNLNDESVFSLTLGLQGAKYPELFTPHNYQVRMRDLYRVFPKALSTENSTWLQILLPDLHQDAGLQGPISTNIVYFNLGPSLSREFTGTNLELKTLLSSQEKKRSRTRGRTN